MDNRILSFSLILLLSGCAAHSPISEMLMFKEKQANDGQSYPASYSHAILSTSMDFMPAQKIISTIDENSSYNYSDRSYQSKPFVATHAIFMLHNIDQIAFSVSAGYGVGFDVTYNPYGNYYLTGAINSSQNGQLILQYRLLDGNPAGLSLGANLRQNAHYLGKKIPSHIKTESSSSLGLRSVFTYSRVTDYQQSRPFIYISIDYNYDIFN